MASSKGTKDKSHKSENKKEAWKTKKEPKSKKDKDQKKGEEKPERREGRKETSKVNEIAAAKKRKVEDLVEVPDKKRKKKDKMDKAEKARDGKDKERSQVKDAEESVETDRRRLQGGAADMVNGVQKEKQREKHAKKDKNGKHAKHDSKRDAKHDAKHERNGKLGESKDKAKRDRHGLGPCAAETLDDEVQGGSTGSRAMPSKSRSPARIQLKSSPEAEKISEKAPKAPEPVKPVNPRQSSDHSESESSGERRRKRREHAGLKAASGFGLAPPPPAPAGDAFASGAVMYGPAGPLVPLPEKVKGLLEHQDSLAQEVMRMKMAVEAATGAPGASMKFDSKEDPAETTLKMPTRLTDCLMEPENLAKLLAKTGLLSATLNQEKHLILRAASRKQLQKTLGQLRRIAWACQWGCSSSKAKAVNSMVLRLAATSSRLSSHDAKLNAKMRKIRLGTQAGTGMLVLEGIPGLSRKHCTITFEPAKGACYVQDVSTNGTYLNGKRKPRPPFKNPADARVRLFHGDELLFKLRTDDAEELGYVINLVELS